MSNRDGSPTASGLSKLFQACLWAGATVSLAIILLLTIPRLWTNPSEDYNFGTLAELLLVFVLSVEGIVAVLHLDQSKLDHAEHKRDRVREQLVAMHHRYGTWTMRNAVKTLWDLHREAEANGVPIEDFYLHRVKADMNLDKSRRRVTYFYDLLGGLCATGALPKEDLSQYWTFGELRILDAIVIPLAKAQGTIVGSDSRIEPFLERIKCLKEARSNS